MLILITVAYNTALRPTLAQAYVQGFHTIEDLLNRVMRISSAIAVGAAVGGILIAEPLVLLLYGKAYLPAVPALQILLVLFGLHMVSRIYRVLLISFNRQGNDLRIMSLAAVVNIVLNVIVIKQWGIVGAAWANLACEFLILILDYISAQKFVGKVPLGRYLWKPAICAGLMIPVIQLSHSLHLILQIILGGSVYVAMLFLLRAISMDDARVILKKRAKKNKLTPESSSSNEPTASAINNCAAGQAAD